MPDGIRCTTINTLQVNLGRRCNLACSHCHLDCSPQRSEMMSEEIMESVVDVASTLEGTLVDITGGEPTIHQHFRAFVSKLRNSGSEVQVRTNLTALLDPAQNNLMQFMCDSSVGLVASLPCYMEENVRKQRGVGVYEKSIAALQRLNLLGYGTKATLPLHLVYNPGGDLLPASQSDLEESYREELNNRFGITFTRLMTITNMPIGRFQRQLIKEHKLETYLKMLEHAFNEKTLDRLMCRCQVCVDWDGRLYDCDFNLSLGCTVNHGAPDRIETFNENLLRCRRVVTGLHCFGCTAGAGSSCSGSLARQ